MTRRIRAPRSADHAATATHEVQLKLRVPPARLRALLALPLLRASGASRTLRLTSTYYDTPELQLWRNRILLRVRREGSRWVQAVKGGGAMTSGVHPRLELETVLRDAHPDLSVLPLNKLTKSLHSGKTASRLMPVLITDIRRTVRKLTPAPGVQIELAIDRGEIRCGPHREAVCELELELKRGPVSALFDLALQLVALQPLELEHHSKAERGYALYAPQSAAPLKASAVRLERALDTGAAFRAITAAALLQIQGNARGVIDSDDPEYVHQMRVGLRRLRSAMDLFCDQLGDVVEPHAAGLRKLGAGLGAAREWDVLVTETLPGMTGIPSVAKLIEACDLARQSARKYSIKSIKTISYARTMLVLGRWLASPQTTTGAGWSESARVAAATVLESRHARVLKRGRRLAVQSPEELHRLRIAIKKLRYAVEFFNDLFQVKPMTVQRIRLEKLQDILGFINDAESLEPLFAKAKSVSRQWPVAAADAVVLWHQQRAGRQRKRLASAWRLFRDAPKPWQKTLRR
jgi:inorganic triphosphatase YgiF